MPCPVGPRIALSAQKHERGVRGDRHQARAQIAIEVLPGAVADDEDRPDRFQREDVGANQ